MGIGTSGVCDYTNTTSASATGVVAVGGTGDNGVVAYPVPPRTGFIVTESMINIITENNNYLITE